MIQNTENPKKQNSFLGRGWAFPPGFSSRDKTVLLVEEEEDIRQSLVILLSTQLGERIMQPGYGCNLQSVVFEKTTAATVTYIRDMIETAILYHEPRIKLLRLDVKESDKENGEGKIIFDIIYLVRSTNTRSNLVYPYSLTEATEKFFGQ